MLRYRLKKIYESKPINVSKKVKISELVDFLEEVGNHQDFRDEQHKAIWLCEMIHQHLKLMEDIKNARAVLNKRAQQTKAPVPRVEDVLRGA